MKWAEPEIGALEEHYPFGTRSELLKKLPSRTWPSIRRKASHLGISRNTALHGRGDFDYNLNLVEVEKGYIAGIVDGEGSIELLYQVQHGGGRFMPRIKVSNTNKRLIDWVHCRVPFLGSGFRARPKGNHKPLYELMTRSHKGTLVLLEQIYPYLVVKQKRATLMLEYLKNHRFRLGRRGSGHMVEVPPIPQWEWDIYNKLRELNRRGVVDQKEEEKGREAHLA